MKGPINFENRLHFPLTPGKTLITKVTKNKTTNKFEYKNVIYRFTIESKPDKIVHYQFIHPMMNSLNSEDFYEDDKVLIYFTDSWDTPKIIDGETKDEIRDE